MRHSRDSKGYGGWRAGPQATSLGHLPPVLTEVEGGTGAEAPTSGIEGERHMYPLDGGMGDLRKI
eukprot:71797-Prorocentrum_lima.AAC.1